MRILPSYQGFINKWQKITQLPKKEKQTDGMFGVMIHRGKDTYKEFQKLIKYLDQWYFIEQTSEFVGKVFERPTILKKMKRKVCSMV